MSTFNFEKMVRSICNEMADFLIEKNKCYGNSALDPVHCFYKGGAKQALLVRIDDKISRLMRGQEYGQDDTIKDLHGYLVLLEVLKRKEEMECGVPF